MEIKIIDEKDAPTCKTYCHGVCPTKEELYDMYWNKGMNMYQIADDLVCSEGTIRRIMNKYDIIRRSKSDVTRKYSINKEFFIAPCSHNKSWVLGYFCADGHISNDLRYFGFDSADRELLSATRSAMKSEHPIKKDKRYDGYYIRISCFEMVQDLLNLGITPAKSLTLKFPNVPEEFIGSFIRGVFDGDGSVYLKNVQNSICVNISCASDNFTLKLNSIIHKNGINSYLWRSCGELCGILITKKSEVKKFYDFIYQHDGIYLKRKKDIFDKFFGCDISETI